jgi:hypothetical protein
VSTQLSRLLKLLGATLLSVLVGLVPTAVSAPAIGAITGTTVPKTVVLDGAQLVTIKAQLATGTASSSQKAALNSLLAQANTALTAGPWSVTDKNVVPPSGDKHDYLSHAPYQWASKPKTPGNPLGCPYVNRDGQRNPEADAISDHAERAQAFDAIPNLALAWFYTHDAKYAQRAALDIRTWFLDPATKMNPNLTYSQVIPCVDRVSGTGIIDTSQSISSVFDAFAILDSGAPGWTSEDHSAATTWVGQFLNWMQTSPQAKLELAATNNHGSYIDMQNATAALYIGNKTMAKSIVESVKKNRIAKQIKADGSQPLELTRTISWHYANFNLTALGRLAEIGKQVGVDLWGYTAPNGGSIDKAVDFLIPAAEKGVSAWSYPQISPLDQSISTDILHAAAEQGHDKLAAAAIPLVPKPPIGDLWPIRPSALCLDNPLK